MYIDIFSILGLQVTIISHETRITTLEENSGGSINGVYTWYQKEEYIIIF